MIKEQERQLIHMVLWMLRREVLKLRGLQQVTDSDERRLGQQDAIDMLEDSIVQGATIEEVDIEKVVDEVRRRHKIQGD
jgi:hypothetical protein